MKGVLRDGIDLPLDRGSRVKARATSDGHVIETWKSNGKRVYFANLVDSVYCAHGDTAAQAIADALWKDPKRRPSLEALIAEIKPVIQTRKITLQEFRLLTGACESGCRAFLSSKGLTTTVKMTLAEFVPIGGDWARKLEQVLKEERE